MKTMMKLWLLTVLLIILVPLGLIVPQYFKAGAAWGEWGLGEIKEFVGYVPKGLERLSSIWNAPIPDYAFKGWGEKGLGGPVFAYIISAVIGVATVVGTIYVIKILLNKRE